MFCFTTIVCLFTILFGVSTASGKNNENNVIPRNFEEAISLINAKREYADSIQQDTTQFINFINYAQREFNIVSHVGNLLSSISSNRKLDAQFPNLTQSCLIQVFAFSQAFTKREQWSFKVIDSLGKPPSGILQGGLIWAGEYTECRNITVPSISFQGKYCYYKKSNKLNAATSNFIGICAPKQCNEDDITSIINLVIESLPQNITNILPISLAPISSEYIQCKEDVPLDRLAIFTIIFLSIIGSLVLIATLYDVYSQFIKASPIEQNDEQTAISEKKDNEPVVLQILKGFSFYTNALKIFSISHNIDQLECLNGIRCLSFGWVVLGHTYMYTSSLINNYLGEPLFDRFSFLIVSNAYFAVDSFFFLSGLLLCYAFMKEINKSKQGVTIRFMIKYYVHRYWRLTPVYAIVLMISAGLSGYLGDGPFYPIGTGFETNKCRDTWWTNLLYINNLVKTKQMCFPVSWYMSNDMQFHWIAPIILLPFALKKKIFGFIVSGVVLLASILSIGLIMNANPGSELGMFGMGRDSFMKLVYFPPWSRIGPFIVGLIYGYFIFYAKTKSQLSRWSWKFNLIGWFLSLFFVSILVFGLYPDYHGNSLSRTAHIFYQSTSRTVWAAALGFMVYSCVTGNGGIINTILSWSVWVPLARLSYSAYLIHNLVVLYYYNTMKHPLYLQDETMYYLAISHVVLSYAAAFLISTFFEAPFIALEKHVFRWKK